MSRARPYDHRSAATSSRGRGCISIFLLTPLLILAFGAAMLILSPEPPVPEPTLAPASAASALSPIFTPQVQYWSSSILRWGAESGLDPNLLAVVMQLESCGNPYARSSAGALGLFQVMPYHFQAGDDPFAPDTNALRGSAYLERSLASSNNDVRLALAGYNGGIGIIARPDWLWPAESVRYAYWGSGIYQDAVSGSTASPWLAEWLAAGGASMCSRAGSILQL